MIGIIGFPLIANLNKESMNVVRTTCLKEVLDKNILISAALHPTKGWLIASQTHKSDQHQSLAAGEWN